MSASSPSSATTAPTSAPDAPQSSTSAQSASAISAPIAVPRIVITFCTQCRWMLRAAYFAQELFSTFGDTIGEIALRPATGGLFRVELTYDTNMIAKSTETTAQTESRGVVDIKEVLLWDRKTEGGFPETKVLKQRVRDYLEPKRDLGHSDVVGKNKASVKSGESMEKKKVAGDGGEKGKIEEGGKESCEDCK